MANIGIDSHQPANQGWQNGDEGEENGASERDMAHSCLKKILSGLALPDPGDKGPVLFHVGGDLFRFKLGRCPKVSKEYNEEHVERHVNPASWIEVGGELSEPGPFAHELPDGTGEHEKGGGEDDRDDACVVHFKRDVGVAPLHFVAAHNASCILEGDPSLSLDHQDGPYDDEDKEGAEDDEHREGELTGFLRAQIELADDRSNGSWERGQDPCGDDQADAIADPFFGDLFSDPHEEEGSGGHRDHDGEVEEPGDAEELDIDHFRDQDARAAEIDSEHVSGIEGRLEEGDDEGR